jgi:hypothetical protein
MHSRNSSYLIFHLGCWRPVIMDYVPVESDHFEAMVVLKEEVSSGTTYCEFLFICRSQLHEKLEEGDVVEYTFNNREWYPGATIISITQDFLCSLYNFETKSLIPKRFEPNHVRRSTLER